MPSSTEFIGSVSNETANVRSSKRNAHDVVGHHSSNGITHIVLVTEVISEPSGSEFTHTSICTSFNDHGSLVLRFEPLVGSLSLHGTEERVCIKLGNILGHHFLIVGMNAIERKRFGLQISHSWDIWKEILNWA